MKRTSEHLDVKRTTLSHDVVSQPPIIGLWYTHMHSGSDYFIQKQSEQAGACSATSRCSDVRLNMYVRSYKRFIQASAIAVQ